MIRKCALVAVMLPIFSASQAVADSLPESGQYVVSFKVSQVTNFTTGPKQEQKTQQRLIAFQGRKVLVSADSEAGKSNAFVGTEHTGPGKKCKKDGTAGVFCNSISVSGNSLSVQSTYNFQEGVFVHTHGYTVSFDNGRCQIRKASYSLKSTKIFEGSNGKLLGSSCSKR